jgi:hypothetical protein
MRWKVPEELTPKEEKLVARMRRKSRFYVFLREIRGQLFDENFQTELASVYSPRGQDPVPPALLAMVSLLQAYTGVSDAEAVDQAEMDLRWQLVLGTLGRDKAPFGQGSLPRFRERLIEHDLDRRLLDRTVELAKETGGFGWQKLKAALDSSPHVAVHLNVPLILAAEVHPANVPEHESVPSLFEALGRYGELEALAIDRGFLNHPDVAALQRAGTAVACRPWPLQNNTGRFSKSEFRIDLRSRMVTCPAGETAP